MTGVDFILLIDGQTSRLLRWHPAHAMPTLEGGIGMILRTCSSGGGVSTDHDVAGNGRDDDE
jgi:hypothetical protein